MEDSTPSSGAERSALRTILTAVKALTAFVTFEGVAGLSLTMVLVYGMAVALGSM